MAALFETGGEDAHAFVGAPFEQPAPKGERSDFGTRIAAHWPVVARELKRLYPQVGQRDDLLARLDRLVRAAHKARPAHLKARDIRLAATPDWFQRPNQIGYSLYVDRFGGTLSGLIETIPHLTALGVTYLHLLPIFLPQSGESDGGFAVADHRRVDPRLGTNADLARLARALDEAGITLCLDVVCNHTARDHAWAQAALTGDEAAQARYHIIRDERRVAEIEATLDEVFPDDAPKNFTYEPALSGWVWTTFYPYQWDLNYANPDVFVELVDVVLTLANLGAGALRLDAVAYIWKDIGTICRGRPEAHAVLAALRAIVDIVAPGTLLKAEAIETGNAAAAYFGDGHECQLAYNNALMGLIWATLAGKSAAPWRHAIEEVAATPEGSSWLLYLRCHDDIGWDVLSPFIDGTPLVRRSVIDRIADQFEGKSPAAFGKGIPFQANATHRRATNGTLAALVGLPTDEPGEEDLAILRIILLYATLFAFPGLPVIWMGDELGTTNAPLTGEGDGRAAQRPLLNAADFLDQSRLKPLSRLVLGIVRHLTSLRAACPAFHAASPIVVPGGEGLPDAVLAIRRGLDDSAVLMLGNFSPAPVTVDWRWLSAQTPHFALVDLIGGQTIGCEADLVLEPYQALWLAPPAASR